MISCPACLARDAFRTSAAHVAPVRRICAGFVPNASAARNSRFATALGGAGGFGLQAAMQRSRRIPFLSVS